MRCDRCQGQGTVRAQLGPTTQTMPWVCPECQGSGVAYCCDDAGANLPNVWEKNGMPQFASYAEARRYMRHARRWSNPHPKDRRGE